MGNVVEIPDKSSKKGFRLVTIFEEAEAEQDSNGQWKVKLECTQKAMKYFFNIENLGYLRYKLRCITSLTSRYTYIMFIYLEANRFRKSWEVDLEELKHILACENEETYKEFKHFNNLLLKKVQKELLEKTECRYTYEPIKKGRSVVAVRFTVETLPKLTFEDVDPNQYTIFDVQEEIENEEREYFCDEEFNDFTDEQLDVLRELIRHKVPEDLIESHYAVLQNRLEAYRWASADYLRRQVKVARLRKPKNLFAYVKKMLENE
jgi:plasmid replication initiation protein